MSRSLARTATALLASLALLITVAGSSSAEPGEVRWVQRYRTDPLGTDTPADITVTPDGSSVVVTGYPSTIAYEADTGATRWSIDPKFSATTVGANGKKIFVTGCTCMLAAYDPASGAKLWNRAYGEPQDVDDQARELAVSADGRRVFIVGTNPIWTGSGYDNEIVVTAVAAGTGAALWNAHYDGPFEIDDDTASDIATTAAGGLVVVTGNSVDKNGYAIAVAVAFDGTTGDQLWVKRFGSGWGQAVTISPDGSTVYASGALGFKTVALHASTGAKQWVRGYVGGEGADFGTDVVVTADGSTLLVTGESDNSLVTFAYDASTGQTHWRRRHAAAGGYARAVELAITSDGQTAVVAGLEGVLVGDSVSDSSFDFATVAYSIDTGGRRWVRRYDGPVDRRDFPVGIAASPSDGVAFVTGWSKGKDQSDDYLTFAYEV